MPQNFWTLALSSFLSSENILRSIRAFLGVIINFGPVYFIMYLVHLKTQPVVMSPRIVKYIVEIDMLGNKQNIYIGSWAYDVRTRV